jgi:hypothetical protein
MLRPVHDPGFAIVAEGRDRAKQAFPGLFRPGDVGVSPGGEEEVHAWEDTR